MVMMGQVMVTVMAAGMKIAEMLLSKSGLSLRVNCCVS